MNIVLIIVVRGPLSATHLLNDRQARRCEAYPPRGRQPADCEGTAVQAYIAAMPGWKSDVGRRIDVLVVRTIPGVRKAVKWNSPLHRVEGYGWSLGIHCFTKYVKVVFFRGASCVLFRPATPRAMIRAI